MRIRALQDQYNRWHQQRLSVESHDGMDPRELDLFAWLSGLLDARQGEKLLDVGCGQGKFLAFALQRGLSVFGVDLSDVAIESARARAPDATLHVGDAQELPFDDSSFDHVTCIGSLEHFPDPLAGAKEMRRVLRPAGTAVIFVPNLFFLGHIYFGLRHGTQPSEGGQGFSEMFLTSQGWSDLLAEAGFDVHGFESWNYIFASDRVSPLTKRLWNRISWLVPRHGAYAFAFVCTTG